MAERADMSVGRFRRRRVLRFVLVLVEVVSAFLATAFIVGGVTDDDGFIIAVVLGGPCLLIAVGAELMRRRTSADSPSRR